MIERLKNYVAIILDRLGIIKFLFNRQYKNDANKVRIINYHRTPDDELETFKQQLDYYHKNFKVLNYEELKLFIDGKLRLDRPGLFITFDDGLKNNYSNAYKLLHNADMKAMFFISAGKIGEEGYMDKDDVKDLLANGYSIGCHTYSHHRMNIDDTDELLFHEVVMAKKVIEENCNDNIDSFCWCGGEEDTYTKSAEELIEKNYDYAFLTNNKLVYPNENKYCLQRTNIEARWHLSLVKFQLSGIMDVLYENKRNKVNEKLNLR